MFLNLFLFPKAWALNEPQRQKKASTFPTDVRQSSRDNGDSLSETPGGEVDLPSPPAGQPRMSARLSRNMHATFPFFLFIEFLCSSVFEQILRLTEYDWLAPDMGSSREASTKPSLDRWFEEACRLGPVVLCGWWGYCFIIDGGCCISCPLAFLHIHLSRGPLSPYVLLRSPALYRRGVVKST